MDAHVQNAVLAAILLVGLGITVPLLAGGGRFAIVMTGSMEPRLGVGDVIAIEPTSAESIEVGEVMAFHDPTGKHGAPIVHRVVEKERTASGLTFKTKGDALEERDPWTVQEEHVVGQVSLRIPKIGLLVDALQTGNRLLYVALIVVPAGALIHDELRKILGDEPEPEPVSGPSMLEPVARDLHERFSDVDEDGVEQSMIAWLASRFVRDEPFEVVDEPVVVQLERDR